MIKIGLKSNAAFLFPEMRGDTLGGTEGGIYWNSIVHLTKRQLLRFKKLIIAFGGNPQKCLTKYEGSEVDYECYFIKD